MFKDHPTSLPLPWPIEEQPWLELREAYLNLIIMDKLALSDPFIYWSQQLTSLFRAVTLSLPCLLFLLQVPLLWCQYYFNKLTRPVHEQTFWLKYRQRIALSWGEVCRGLLLILSFPLAFTWQICRVAFYKIRPQANFDQRVSLSHSLITLKQWLAEEPAAVVDKPTQTLKALLQIPLTAENAAFLSNYAIHLASLKEHWRQWHRYTMIDISAPLARLQGLVQAFEQENQAVEQEPIQESTQEPIQQSTQELDRVSSKQQLDAQAGVDEIQPSQSQNEFMAFDAALTTRTGPEAVQLLLHKLTAIRASLLAQQQELALEQAIKQELEEHIGQAIQAQLQQASQRISLKPLLQSFQQHKNELRRQIRQGVEPTRQEQLVRYRQWLTTQEMALSSDEADVISTISTKSPSVSKTWRDTCQEGTQFMVNKACQFDPALQQLWRNMKSTSWTRLIKSCSSQGDEGITADFGGHETPVVVTAKVSSA